MKTLVLHTLFCQIQIHDPSIKLCQSCFLIHSYIHNVLFSDQERKQNMYKQVFFSTSLH